MVFLILLALAFGGATLFFLVLVGLFEAPWPLLLGGLLLAFFSLQRLSPQPEEAIAEVPPTASKWTNRARNQPTTPASAQPMHDELVYRGIRYTHVEPTGQPAANEAGVLGGTYRGKHWQFPKPPPSPAAPARDLSDEIVYRGCKVRKNNSQPS